MACIKCFVITTLYKGYAFNVTKEGGGGGATFSIDNSDHKEPNTRL